LDRYLDLDHYQNIVDYFKTYSSENFDKIHP